MNEHWTDRLSAYLDGDLASPDRDACAAHLAVCDVCREVLADVAALAAEAAAPAAAGPARDLWPGIEARLTPVAHTAGPRRFSFSLPELALAATLLMAVSGAVSWLVITRGPSAPPAETPIRAVAESTTSPDAGLALANFADVQYDAAVSDLERILLDERSRLDPRTVLVLERNLRTIDDAIAQARQALRADPSNTFLNSHLADSRQRKLELLRRAADLAGGD